LKRVNDNLKTAMKYCANQTQENMLKEYIVSFENGSIDKHKDSQRLWVKDRDPVVEFNMGWIETYIDPMGVRAYYEVIFK
jgi:dipeptidyl-peptidase-3